MKKQSIIFFLFLLFSASISAKPLDIIRFGTDVTITPNQHVQSVVSVGGDITINGTVEENVLAIGGSINLGPKAIVKGDVVSVEGAIQTEANAKIYKRFQVYSGKDYACKYIPQPIKTHSQSDASKFVFLIVAGLLLLYFFPKTLSKISQNIACNTRRMLATGIVGSILIVPILLLLIISILGIIFIPFFILGLFIMVLFGQVTIIHLMGTLLIDKTHFKLENKYGQFLVGIAALCILSIIPFVGGLLECVLILLGFGATLHAIIKKIRK
jgi:hypothetical protein